MKGDTLVLAFALCLVAAGTAWSAENEAPAADVSAGKAIAATCAACHGEGGISSQAGIPSIAGQHASYIQAALTAYKTGARTSEAMQHTVAELSQQDIANVAAFYASLKGFNARPKQPGTTEAAGADQDPFADVKKLTAKCAGCHGEDGNSKVPTTPSLAGQHDNYLVTAIQGYHNQTRADRMMQVMTKSLTLSQVEDIAYYYAAMVPLRSTSEPKGDPLAGMAVAAPCASCHGTDGNGTDPKNPRLAGLSSAYLITAINSYKDGSRAHEVMRDQVIALRDEDVMDVAAYYASQDPQALAIRKPLTVAEWTARCSRCHGENGNSTDPRFPVLAGQDESYLAAALGRYHKDERENEFMFAMTFLMTESDIDKLAAYYAQQREE